MSKIKELLVDDEELDNFDPYNDDEDVYGD